MRGSTEDGNGLLGRDVRTVLQVPVLPLLLGLQVQSSQSTQVLPDNGLVDGSTSPDTLSVIVRDRSPPIGLALDVSQQDVLDSGRHPWNLPRNVGLPTSPSFRQVLHDGLGLVLTNRLGHHVEDITHDGSTQLQVEVRLDTLLGDRLGDSLRVSSLELSGQQVVEPSLEQGNDTSHEEQPDPPSWRPEPDTGTLSNGTRVEPRVDQVFQILAHPDLLHQLVLVTVHSGQLSDMTEHVLETIGELERIDVTQSELHVGIHNELGQTQDFSDQMEGVSESRLFPLLGRQRLDGFQVHVVVQVEVVQVLPTQRDAITSVSIIRRARLLMSFPAQHSPFDGSTSSTC